MKKLIFIAAMMATQAQAATLGEEERFVVNKLNSKDFEVIRLQQMATAELWCAAASFVERRLGLPETTAIYVRRPLGPAQTASGRQGVVFTLDGSGLPPAQKSLTLTVDAPGTMLKSARAYRYCRDAFTRSTK